MNTNKVAFLFSLLKFWIHKKDPVFEMYMRNKKVIDIGCGTGELLAKDTNMIYGVDLNQTLVNKLQKLGLKVKYGTAIDIPYEDNEFDVVHCRNIIEHLFPLEAHRMFLEMKRILKKDGIIILITPMPKTVWNTFGHTKPYPPMAIKKLFRKVSLESFNSVSGLEIKNIFYFGSWGRNKITFLLSTIIAQLTPFCRGSYLMIIKKNEDQ